MDDHGPGCRRRMQQLCTIMFAIFSTWGLAQTCCGDGDIPREPLPVSWQSDADLADVFFLNRNLGWAVGSQGVVLRTVNGGRDWLEISQAANEVANELSLSEKFRNMQSGVSSQWTGIANSGSNQFQPLRCRFESVHFVDENHGWIAGGYNVPYVNKSRAVVMKTSDGGVSWQQVEGLVIPRIKRIYFSDGSNGWAVGEMGNLFRTGIYYSSDGGHTWSSQSSGEMKDWIDGVRAGNSFVNLDTSGQPGLIRNNRYEASVLLGDVQSKIAGLEMLDAKQGWAVGSSGTILQSTNGGLSWSEPVSAAEKDLFRQFDFTSVKVAGQKIWIAGSPGTVVFSIDLQTGEIFAHRTGVHLPIHDIHFVDEQFGWLVGALGTIVATTDGGKTWQVQRGEHHSVALLGIALQESELPLELMAMLAGEENRVCGAVLPLEKFKSATSDQARQAIERLGCSTVVPLMATAETESERLEQMVRTIRMLRPNVIVCNSKFRPSPNGLPTIDPESFLNEAIRAAADPTQFSGQIAKAELSAWQVDRLALLDATGKLGIDPGRMLPRTGSTVEDRIAVSRALLNLPLLGSRTLNYRVQDFTIPIRGRESDLFAGLSQAGRPIPTRDAADGFRSNLNAIKLATSKQQKIEQLGRFELNTPQDLQVWHQQVLSWTLSLEESMAGIWLFELAEHYLKLGKTDLAARTLEVMTTRISEHAFSSAALTWLVQHYASDEMGIIEFQRQAEQRLFQNASLAGGQNSNAYQTRAVQTTVGGVSQLSWIPVRPPPSQDQDNSNPTGVELASHTINADAAADEERSSEQAEQFFKARRQLASQFLSRLSQQDPDLVVGAQYRWIEAQIKRKLTGEGAAEGLLKQLVQLEELGSEGIPQGARRELVLSGILPDSESATETIICYRTFDRPRLDGLLDDPVWRRAGENDGAKQLIRSSRDVSLHPDPDLAMFAFDEQFLYAAFRCFKLKGQYYQSSPQPRPRDPDLSRRDRVEFAIDVDRDYRTSGYFMVDHRGWVAESCGGAEGWNPNWFVSHGEDAESWTVELAIPLEELANHPVDAGSTWAIRLARLTYDSQNLWATKDSPWIPEKVGLQVGFQSQPAQYELMQFK